jgi:hypothetical protein
MNSNKRGHYLLLNVIGSQGQTTATIILLEQGIYNLESPLQQSVLLTEGQKAAKAPLSAICQTFISHPQSYLFIWWPCQVPTLNSYRNGLTNQTLGFIFKVRLAQTSGNRLYLFLSLRICSNQSCCWRGRSATA